MPFTARPHIVRADTLDLQAQESPSAQNHAIHPLQTESVGGEQVAAHQAAEMRHVIEERQTEEQHLQDVWNATDGHRERTLDADDVGAEGQQNGTHATGTENGDQEGEGGVDEDGLEGGSSSPSIDDGTCEIRSPMWPERSSSLTPPSALLLRSSLATPDSSPFVSAPAHFPLFAAALFAAETADFDSPASTQQSSSPFTHIPQHLPSWSQFDGPQSAAFSTLDHHLPGEYANHLPKGISDEYAMDKDDKHLGETWTEGLDEDRLDSPALVGHVNDGDEQDKTCTSASFSRTVYPLGIPSEDLHDQGPPCRLYRDEDDIKDLFLSDDDPLLMRSLGRQVLSPTESCGSWNTITEPDGAFNHGDDDADDISCYSDDRFVDSGWGGECLRDTEDIDFDFVYALHTFVATVEGQANALKGDTMVLLDDSNSYWWLVRIVKDSSIGYLPAEHIETPTERLARLNKHRNVDLSAAMLGDSAERSKNPLKKAMRRRNAKTVQFTAPTYVEASDYEDSSDEEDHATNGGIVNGLVHPETEQDASNEQQGGAIANANGAATIRAVSPGLMNKRTSHLGEIKAPTGEPVGSPKLMDNSEAAPLKSRKGTPRNADSFLQDDGVETKKIILTPNLLRENSVGAREKLRSDSLESVEKIASSPEKAKEEAKRKERKPGMLSGLFKSKKKDKKPKVSEDDTSISDGDRFSADSTRQSTLRSTESSPVPPSPEAKSRGKLTKAQPSMTPTSPIVREAPEPARFIAELEGSPVAYEAPTGHEDEIEEFQRARSPVAQERSGNVNIIRLGNGLEKPQQLKTVKHRLELDHFDGREGGGAERPEDSQVGHDDRYPTFMHGTELIHIPTMVADESSEEDRDDDTEETRDDHTEETREGSSTPPSLVEPTPIHDKAENELHPTDDGEDDPTPVQSNYQSPQPAYTTASILPLSREPPPLLDTTGADATQRRRTSQTSTASSSQLLSPSPASTSSADNKWSDANLRAWLDGGGNDDVRDMLIVIHDRSGVQPVGRDHPLMAGLFVDESARLKGMQDELDGLLGGWMEKRRGKVSAGAGGDVSGDV